ncbi:hypothetical protein [Reichenbachiella ulvae]|uniref:HNH endonuclease n=1 Tax=Reichenbachiella ulvae TaxID=2980104 RepID=A0ABT3CQ47_9BACT|nr:hypothetical protein [Reichenbachiella ulvae]MCV9385393.1 hypothetical protein [Reichenbachiella ulvae]
MITPSIKNPKKCWLCNQEGALTGEHKFKRTDIKKALEHEGTKLIYHQNEVPRKTPLQSDNSDNLKFEKLLCNKCNGTLSQPFDKAYEQFISYVLSNFESITRNGHIDFNEIFDEKVYENQLNVIRYYYKHFCCRLAQNSINIDTALIKFLRGAKRTEKLFVHFEIRADSWAILEKLKKEGEPTGNFYNSPLSIYGTKNEFEIVYSYTIIDWFKVEFFYSDSLTKKMFVDLTQFYSRSKVPVRSLFHQHPEDILKGEQLQKLEFDLHPAPPRPEYMVSVVGNYF